MTMINNKSEIINKLFFDELKELIDKYNNIEDETITAIEKIDNTTFAISEYKHWEESHSYLLLGSDKALIPL